MASVPPITDKATGTFRQSYVPSPTDQHILRLGPREDFQISEPLRVNSTGRSPLRCLMSDLYSTSKTLLYHAATTIFLTTKLSLLPLRYSMQPLLSFSKPFILNSSRRLSRSLHTVIGIEDRQSPKSLPLSLLGYVINKVLIPFRAFRTGLKVFALLMSHPQIILEVETRVRQSDEEEVELLLVAKRSFDGPSQVSGTPDSEPRISAAQVYHAALTSSDGLDELLASPKTITDEPDLARAIQDKLDLETLPPPTFDLPAEAMMSYQEPFVGIKPGGSEDYFHHVMPKCKSLTEFPPSQAEEQEKVTIKDISLSDEKSQGSSPSDTSFSDGRRGIHRAFPTQGIGMQEDHSEVCGGCPTCVKRHTRHAQSRLPQKVSSTKDLLTRSRSADGFVPSKTLRQATPAKATKLQRKARRF